MATRDAGLLAVFTDIPDAEEAEFNRWYDGEHMAERVGIPGFVAAQRYRAVAAQPKYLALYETTGLPVFLSDAYQRALANQTAWSRTVMGRFQNLHRLVAARRAVAGAGLGGVAGILRFTANAPIPAASMADLVGPAGRDGVLAGMLYEADPDLSGPPVPLGENRPVTSRREWLLVVQATTETAAREAIMAAGGHVPAGATDRVSGLYRLMWELRAAVA